MIVAPIELMYSELELEKTLAYKYGKEMSFLQKKKISQTALLPVKYLKKKVLFFS